MSCENFFYFLFLFVLQRQLHSAFRAAMEEDTYENLLNYFDSENNMNSGSSTVKEEIHNISLESRRVLTEIDNMLGESVNSEKDVADTEEKIELKIEIFHLVSRIGYFGHLHRCRHQE